MSKSKRPERMAFLSSIGLDPNDIAEWRYKWKAKISNAPKKGNVCLLTFEEYVTIAKESGVINPNEISTSIDSYHLSRFNDIGNYEVGNCRFIKHYDNYEEKKVNGNEQTRIEKIRKSKFGVKRDDTIGESKYFRLISPTGVVHYGINITKFSLSNGLGSGRSMASLCSGVRKTYKGWTGKYVECDEYMRNYENSSCR